MENDPLNNAQSNNSCTKTDKPVCVLELEQEPPFQGLPPELLQQIRQYDLAPGECRLLDPIDPSLGLPYLNPPRPRACSI